MNPHGQLDDSSVLKAEITEERELQRVLERTRLENAAARPVSFWDGWSICVLVGVPVVLYLQERYNEIWVVILVLLFKLMYSIYTGIHNRIDALVELGRLDNRSCLSMKSMQSDDPGVSPKS